jgi:hypothetical protein
MVAMLRPPPERTKVALSHRTSRQLWIVASLDMTAVAWMIAIGDWLDKTSKVTAVITLGGRHVIVLIMALVGFLMLAAAALLTEGLTSAGRPELTLIIMACIVSVVALAGALSAMLLLGLAALLLGFGIRLLLRA